MANMIRPAPPKAPPVYVHRNAPKERAEELAQKLIHLRPPNPMDPQIPGDDKRFSKENDHYQLKKRCYEVEKKQCEDLALDIDLANPVKKRKFLENHFKLMAQTDAGKACIAKFGNPKVLKPTKKKSS
jgi:hypothetical protein